MYIYICYFGNNVEFVDTPVKQIDIREGKGKKENITMITLRVRVVCGTWEKRVGYVRKSRVNEM